MTQRVLDTVRKRPNVRTIVYDMADYPDVHPLLAPFVLLIPLQWFVVYSALRAGFTTWTSACSWGAASWRRARRPGRRE